MSDAPHTNRLAQEISPYLLQHQHVPVDWFPRGDEACDAVPRYDGHVKGDPTMSQATFDEVLEAIELLPADEQADLVELVRRRLAERGRARVIDEAREGRAAFDRGTVRPASVDDILGEIGS